MRREHHQTGIGRKKRKEQTKRHAPPLRLLFLLSFLSAIHRDCRQEHRTPPRCALRITPRRKPMPRWRETAPPVPTEDVTAQSKHRDTPFEHASAVSNSPPSNADGIKKPALHPSATRTANEAVKSFPQGLTSPASASESSNNRYHCGFAQ